MEFYFKDFFIMGYDALFISTIIISVIITTIALIIAFKETKDGHK